MTHLLDINVLIALCDPAHPHADAARQFFSTVATRGGWATCPFVENGFLRIFGARKYPSGPGSPQRARPLLAGLLATPGHQLWHDDLTLMDENLFPDLSTSGNLTDIYLLGLAVQRGGRFATFDHRINASLIPGGEAAILKL